MNKQEQQKLEKKIINEVNLLFTEKSPIILGYSGGPDSVFLLEMLKLAKKEVYCLHLNHGIRNESDFEQIFCAENGVNTITHKLNIKKLAKVNNHSLEQEGRIQRYSLLQKTAEEKKALYITTAHHGNDSIETSLFNLIRGAGLDGIKGIEKTRTLGKYQLIRPLLDISKKTILDYLNTKNIPFVIDQSNDENKYNRNKIRNIIIPAIEKINDNFEQTYLNNLQIFSELKDFTDQTVSKFLHENKLPLNRGDFLNNHPYIQKEIIRKIHRRLRQHFKDKSRRSFRAY